MEIAIKRIYENFAETDGFRILVDRLWPRGLKKEEAKIDVWFKEIAPSTSLRQWFHHEESNWPTFVKRYEEELAKNEARLQFLALVKAHAKITLLYGAKDPMHNQAEVLKAWLTTLI